MEVPAFERGTRRIQRLVNRVITALTEDRAVTISRQRHCMAVRLTTMAWQAIQFEGDLLRAATFAKPLPGSDQHDLLNLVALAVAFDRFTVEQEFHTLV